MRATRSFYVLFLLISLVFGPSNVQEKSWAAEVASPSESDSGGWSDTVAEIAGKVFLGAENGVLFYGFDCLACPNEPVDLVVKAKKGRFMKDLDGVMISYHQKNVLLGTAKTDDEGVAVLRWRPPGPGDFNITAQIVAVGEHDPEVLQTSPVPLLVMVRPKEARFVVIDLDHTLVDDGFAKVLAGGGKPMAGSIEVTQRIKTSYDILYLTQRPDIMTRTSKGWLQRHGYPQGVLLVSAAKDLLGSSGSYKTARIATLQQVFPQVQIGIGDKISDALAYVDNGMQAYLIPHYDATEAEDIRDMAREIRTLKRQKKLQVVSRWSQIEAGIFEDKRFSPSDFATWLESRADDLERQKRLRKQHKEEEDD